MEKKKRKKIRDGFQGEKLISIPTSILRKMVPQLIPHQPYITHIGYFPNASYHYRLRKYGCEDDILFYCLKGKGYYKIADRKYELSTNQFIIIPATIEHVSYWADPDDPWTIYWLHFTGAEIEDFNKTLGIGDSLQPVSIPYNGEGLKIWNTIYETLAAGYQRNNMLCANLCLHHLISTFLYPRQLLTTINNREKAIINQTILYMKNNLDKKFTVEDLANRVYLSVSYFSKLFRQSTGMPPIDYFIYLKMQHACHLLCTTDFMIKQIAMSLGYDDPYYFSRLFKKINNNSPEEFRTICKEVL